MTTSDAVISCRNVWKVFGDRPERLQLTPQTTMDELRAALAKAIDDQMKHGKTTLIEALINQELGEPFRRDAMKKPSIIQNMSASELTMLSPS